MGPERRSKNNSLSPEQVAHSAALRLLRELENESPTLWLALRPWLSARSELATPEKYFFATHSFPLLMLPWWFEEKLSGSADREFHDDLMYSSVALYYWIRLMDDAMDHHPLDPAVLAAMYVLPNKSLRAYRKYFGPAHPFWRFTEAVLAQTADAVAGEFTTTDFDQQAFVNFSARKALPALIPLLAVAHRYDALEYEQWRHWLFLFLRWHQMHDDLLDWNADLQSNTPTFLLAEAQRRKLPDESVAEWMGREGYSFSKSLMDTWFNETLVATEQLESAPLLEYVRNRQQSAEAYFAQQFAMAEIAGKLVAAAQSASRP